MKKAELLKQYAAQGMTARQAAEAARSTCEAARVCASKGGFKFAPMKKGRPFGYIAPPSPRQSDADLSAIEQMLADIARLPVAKRNDYRTLRVNHGVPHETVMAVLS